jgi:transposase
VSGCSGVSAVSKLIFARAAKDETEEKKVRRLARASHAPADWIRRAQIITASWDGLRVPQIAMRLGCHQQTVRRWLDRFNTAGLDGLGNRPGCGRKRRITEGERGQIIALARSVPPGRPVRQADGVLEPDAPGGPMVWTLDTLTAAAQAAGIAVHRSQVRRILLAEKVRWRHPRSWAVSTDAEFAPKGRRSSPATPARRRTPRSSAPTSWVR